MIVALLAILPGCCDHVDGLIHVGTACKRDGQDRVRWFCTKCRQTWDEFYICGCEDRCGCDRKRP